MVDFRVSSAIVAQRAFYNHKADFVCLFVCAYDSRYACGGTATAETAFPGRDPEYTRVTAEETRCRIATSPLVDHPGNRGPGSQFVGRSTPCHHT